MFLGTPAKPRCRICPFEHPDLLPDVTCPTAACREFYSGVGSVDIEPNGPVTIGQRQGVFIHAFRCGSCSLHFALFSWRNDRHRVGEIVCPECREATPMGHWLTVVSESKLMVRDGSSPEVFDFVPGDGVLLDDTAFLAPDE